MNFKMYRQDLKVTGESLKFECGRGGGMTAVLKNSELFYRSTVSILFCLKTLTLQSKVT